MYFAMYTTTHVTTDPSGRANVGDLIEVRSHLLFCQGLAVDVTEIGLERKKRRTWSPGSGRDEQHLERPPRGHRRWSFGVEQPHVVEFREQVPWDLDGDGLHKRGGRIKHTVRVMTHDSDIQGRALKY